MGQMVFIDEDELNQYKMCAKYFEYCMEIADRADNDIYTDREVWLDTGTNAQVTLEILETMYRDLLKKKRKKLAWQRRHS